MLGKVCNVVLVVAALQVHVYHVQAQSIPDYGNEANATASNLASYDSDGNQVPKYGDTSNSGNVGITSESNFDSMTSMPDYSPPNVTGMDEGDDGCDCACKAVTSGGQEASQDDLLKQKATLSCSTCCEPEELIEEMKPYLPELERFTKDSKACNSPNGLLSIFLQPTCWKVEEDLPCSFPFIYGYNQVVVNCTQAGDKKPWCVYDMDKWNAAGEGWGYCKPYEPKDSGVLNEDVIAALNPNKTETAKTLNDTQVDKILASLTTEQQKALKENDQFNSFLSSVKHSGGLTTAGIAAIVVVCILIVGVLITAVVVTWKLRNRIKLRRESKFQNMEQEPADASAFNGGEVAMARI